MKRGLQLVPWLIVGALLYFPLGGWKVLQGGQEGNAPAPRSYGERHDVPGFHWVVLLNENGLATADTQLEFFEMCLIRYRGRVQEITSHYSWYAWWSDDVLLEYRNPDSLPPVGVQCPDGAVFLLPGPLVRGFDDLYGERVRFEETLAAEVRDVLARTRGGAPFPVDRMFRWVEALNPAGVENFGYRIGFLDACGIEEGGTVRALADTSQGLLYEYQPDPARGFLGIGIPCPADTVFTLDSSPPRYF
jgi:hypothetical protein